MTDPLFNGTRMPQISNQQVLSGNEEVQSSGSGAQSASGAVAEKVLSRIGSLEAESNRLKKESQSFTALVKKLETRVAALEKGGSSISNSTAHGENDFGQLNGESEGDDEETRKQTATYVPKKMKEAGDHTDTELQEQLYTATHAGNFSVKIKEDTGLCNIGGSCAFPDGSMLLTDYDNNKLKYLDSSYKVIDFCEMEESPLQVCCVGEMEAAVSTYKHIHFVSVHGRLTFTRFIQLEQTCVGLAFSRSELYVPYTRRNRQYIYVYNTAGNHLRTVDISQFNNSFPFVYVDIAMSVVYSYNNIATSNDGSQLYVCMTSGVVCLDEHGKQLWEFTDDAICGAHGVCVGSDNNLFVFGPTSVLQISTNGQKIGHIIQESDNENPIISIRYAKLRSQLVVTHFSCDHIEMFDLTR